MERIVKNILNCPNCGATITGANCEYCGAIFYDFANLDTSGTNYIRLKHNGSLYIFKTVIMSCEVCYNEPTYFYADNQPVCARSLSDGYDMKLEMRIFPDDKGIFYEKRDERFE